jgi:hypothetical protein
MTTNLNCWEMQRLGLYDKLRNHFKVFSWWEIAYQLSYSNEKFKIVYSMTGDYELFKEYPTAQLEKKLTSEPLYLDGFEFDTEQDKLAFLLKWS